MKVTKLDTAGTPLVNATTAAPASAPAAPAPNTAAYIRMALDGIDSRLEYLRGKAAEYQSVVAEIAQLESERAAIAVLVDSLTLAAAVPQEGRSATV